MVQRMKKVAFLLGSICSYSYIHASPIPVDQCAIIVTSSADKLKTQADLLKFKSAFDIPLIIKSNNNMYAGAIGLYDREKSKTIIEGLKLNELIPKDAYCDNNQRFISANKYSININGELVEIQIESTPVTNKIIANYQKDQKTDNAATQQNLPKIITNEAITSPKDSREKKAVEIKIQPIEEKSRKELSYYEKAKEQFAGFIGSSNDGIKSTNFVDQQNYLTEIKKRETDYKEKINKISPSTRQGAAEKEKLDKEYRDFHKKYSGAKFKDWVCVSNQPPIKLSDRSTHTPAVKDRGDLISFYGCYTYSKKGEKHKLGNSEITVHFIDQYILEIPAALVQKIDTIYNRDRIVISGEIISGTQVQVNALSAKGE
jgi:hypothetical protein